MLPSSGPPQTLDYETVQVTEGPRWQRALGWIAVIANGILSTACAVWATQLAPQFGDATSRHGVIVPLLFWKLPLVGLASLLLTLGARRVNIVLGRVSSAFTWAILAVWLTVGFLVYRP
jgi:hypothetical protein